MTWYDETKSRVHQYKAEIICENRETRLPTRDDLYLAEKHGIREIIPDMKNKLSWSSSVDPDRSGYAYGFYGFSGRINYGYRDKRGDDNSVRCVASR